MIIVPKNPNQLQKDILQAEKKRREDLKKINEPEGIIKSYLEDLKDQNFPKEDLLEIRWTKDRKGRKLYAICCRCGNIRMLKVERGLRCSYCSLFHSYETWNKLRIKVHAIARFSEGGLLKIEQNFSKQQKIDKEIY